MLKGGCGKEMSEKNLSWVVLCIASIVSPSGGWQLGGVYYFVLFFLKT